MAKINNLTKIVFLLLFVFAGCKEFIEPSIAKRTVNLLAPANGTAGAVYAQTFWWEPVEDALSYRLQVATPGFTNTQRLILDTLIKANNKFNFTMDPGNYEWRVRAENGSSQTQYTTAAFTIYATSIKEQTPQLQAPANNITINTSSTTFSWSKLFGADKYHLEVDTNNFADEKVLFLDKTVTTLQFTAAITKDKLYQWRVKALNDTAESKWSQAQSFTFDSTPPAQVVLTAPATNTSISSPVTLKWNAVSTAAKYQLYVYKSNQTDPYNSTFPLALTATTYIFTGVSGEKVYWQVAAIDAAGNVGALSELRNFTVL